MKALIRFLLPVLAVVAVAAPALSLRDTPPPARTVLASAQDKAAKEKKAVLVGFHASWCGWCKRMEKTLSDPKLAAIMDKYFVTVWLTVLESDDKKSLENPGAEDEMIANGGKDQGIPFLYFTDAKGKTIITSKRPSEGADKGGNVGCPYEASEIAYWLSMLKKAAPSITDSEIQTMKSGFEALKKADGKG